MTIKVERAIVAKMSLGRVTVHELETLTFENVELLEADTPDVNVYGPNGQHLGTIPFIHNPIFELVS